LSEGGEILRIDLRPSWRLAFLIVGLHATAGASVFLAIPNLAGAVLAMLLAALGGTAAWDRALLRGPRSPRTLRVSADGTLRVEHADRTRLQAGDGPRTVTRWMVALPLEGAVRRSVLIAPDMLDASSFRLLRLWALWGRVPGVASAQLPG
jgi:toxin CptA